jgi:hypothetical protein
MTGRRGPGRPRRSQGASNATGEGGSKGEQDVTQRKRKRGASNAAGEDKGEQDVTQQETTLPPQQVPNGSVVDLSSKSATHVANIIFLRAQQYSSPIVQFECLDCLETCEYIRKWLQTNGPVAIQSLVRIEDQKLNLLGPQTKGTLLLFERVASLEGDMQFPISVFSLYIPEDKDVRYFWCLLSPSNLLMELTKRKLLGPPIDIPYVDKPPNRSKTGTVLPSRHHMLVTFLANSFALTTKFPHAPAYLTACQISDVCPSILKPATAHDRIVSAPDLRRANDTTGGKDLADDRYLEEIHHAERALVSIIHGCCAEYMLIKRKYFKAFSREVILDAAKVRRAAAGHHNEQRHTTPVATRTAQAQAQAHEGEGEGEGDHSESPADTPHSTPLTTRSRARSVASQSSAAVAQAATHRSDRVSAAQTGARNRAPRVRTMNAHFRAVEALSGWNFAKAKRLVLGWEILGFLDEERVLAVVDGGGGEDDGEENDEE